MSKNSKNIPATINNEATSGIGALPSEAKPKQVKQQEFGQLAPSDQPDDLGSTSVASKPRSTKRRARRIYRDPARPDDGAARHPKWKRPNAQKHGVFSAALLIPGEDPREFDQLLAELMDAWKPGPILRDGVVELADLKWKLRRLRKFIQTRLSAMTFDPRSPSFNETWGDIMFIHYLRSEPETCFEQRASSCQRADRIDYLEQKFPRSNYQSTAEWVNALIGEIMSASLPAKPKFAAAELGDLVDEAREASLQWKTECKVAGTIMHASELLEYELTQSERLDARITRKIKSCFELKTMEQMLHET
jgi:hypothetical protein